VHDGPSGRLKVQVALIALVHLFWRAFVELVPVQFNRHLYTVSNEGEIETVMSSVGGDFMLNLSVEGFGIVTKPP
jgi:hypothetical protein